MRGFSVLITLSLHSDMTVVIYFLFLEGFVIFGHFCSDLRSFVILQGFVLRLRDLFGMSCKHFGDPDREWASGGTCGPFG